MTRYYLNNPDKSEGSIDSIFKQRNIDVESLYLKDILKKDEGNYPYKRKHKYLFPEILKYVRAVFEACNIDIPSQIYGIDELLNYISRLAYKRGKNFTTNEFNLTITFSTQNHSVEILIVRKQTKKKVFRCVIRLNLNNLEEGEDYIKSYSINITDVLSIENGLQFYEKVTYNLREELMPIVQGISYNYDFRYNLDKQLPVPKWVLGTYLHINNLTDKYLEQCGYQKNKLSTWTKECSSFTKELCYLPNRSVKDLYSPLHINIYNVQGRLCDSYSTNVYEVICLEALESRERAINYSTYIYHNLNFRLSKSIRESLEVTLRDEYDDMIRQERTIV